MPFMSEEEARKAIVAVGRRMYENGYVVTNDGNISVRIPGDKIVVTPTGVSKGFMTPESMVVMSLDGSIVSQGEKGPSSEVKMHLRVYQEDPSIGSVVHAHPVYATSYAIAGIPLQEPILSEAMLQIGTVPVARYAKPGTFDVPDSIAPFIASHVAVLLSNHGALTWGDTLEQAFARMEVVENYAHISYVVDKIGQSRPLSKSQVEGLAEIRKSCGWSDVEMPRGVDEIVNDTDVLPDSSLDEASVLRADCIEVGGVYSSRDDLQAKLAQHFVDAGVALDTYPDAILKREAVYPTGIQARAMAIAISHCDSKYVTEDAIGVCIPENPQPFGEMCGEGTLYPKIVFMLAIKDPAQQVPTLQKVMGVIQDDDLLNSIVAAKTVDEVYGLLSPKLRW